MRLHSQHAATVTTREKTTRSCPDLRQRLTRACARSAIASVTAPQCVRLAYVSARAETVHSALIQSREWGLTRTLRFSSTSIATACPVSATVTEPMTAPGQFYYQTANEKIHLAKERSA